MAVPTTINWGITSTVQKGHIQLIQGTNLDFQGFMEARINEKRRVLWHIEQQIDIFSTETLSTIANIALNDPDNSVRAEACHLIDVWSNVNYNDAAIFIQRIEQISREDFDPWVRKNALAAVKRLSILKDRSIDLVAFALEEESSKFNLLQEVATRVADFDPESIRALVDYSLHDPEVLIRGTGVQLLRTYISVTNANKWVVFQPHIQWMTFHDPSIWVRKQSVVVARKLYRTAFLKQWLSFILIYCIIMGVLNAFTVSAFISNSKNLMPSIESLCRQNSTESIFSSTGVNNATLAVGAHDTRYATIGMTEDSMLILNMGEGMPIENRPGLDFYYFERPNQLGIYIDKMMVSMASDNGSGSPDMNSLHTVFIWGDSDPENNGNIPSKYFTNGEELSNTKINADDLFDKTAIGIDIGESDILAFRYVIIQPYPPHPRIQQTDLLVEIDSIETICPPPSPTSTPSSIQTPTSQTPDPSSLTATQAAILSQTPDPSSLTATQAAILSQTPNSSSLTATQAAILSQTPDPSSLAATQAAILSQTPDPSKNNPSLLIIFATLAMASLALGYFLMEMSILRSERGLDNQKQRLLKNHNITHPLIGQLPSLENRKRIILRELEQRQTAVAQYAEDDLPDNLVREIDQLKAQLEKVEVQIKVIRDA